MKIKVCGMRDAENIRAVEALGVDMMGFIFYPPSPRNVEKVPDYLPKCKRVGVFVNPTKEDVLKKQELFNFSIIQLHGNETPEFCHELRNSLPENTKIFKTIAVEKKADFEKVERFKTLVNSVLFETKCTSFGGSGRQFDWAILEEYKGDLPFILSGGIGLEDAEKIKKINNPFIYAVDVNSKFENEFNLKNIEKLKLFIQKIKDYE